MIGEEDSKLEEAGDFRRFLNSQRGQRVLEDTVGYIYHFKRVIHKRNQFGKVCRCMVWRCKHYKKLNCLCSIYTFGETIIGSTCSHSHTAQDDGSRIELNQLIVSEATNTDKSANTISSELLHKYKIRQRTPQLESVKRSVRRARQHFRKRLHNNQPQNTQKVAKSKVINTEEGKENQVIEITQNQPFKVTENQANETVIMPDIENNPIPSRGPTIEDFPILKDIDTLKEVLELLHEMSDKDISKDPSSLDLAVYSDSPYPSPRPSPLPLGNDGAQISFELPQKPKNIKYPKIEIPYTLPTTFVPNRTINDIRPKITLPDFTPELPSKSEFKILSDQTALQNILNLLKLTNAVPSVLGTPTDIIRSNSAICSTHHNCSSTSSMKCVACHNRITPDTPPPYSCAMNQCDPPKQKRKRGSSNEPTRKRSRSKKPFKYIPPNMIDICPNATIPPNLTNVVSNPVIPKSVPSTAIQDAVTPCISLIPMSEMNPSNFENSKLLKAVHIGNGLYRLEEPDQEIGKVMSKESVYQAGPLTDSSDMTASVYTPSTNSINYDHVGVLPTIAPKPTTMEQPSIFSLPINQQANLFTPTNEPSIFSILQAARIEHPSVVPTTTSILSSLAALVSRSSDTPLQPTTNTPIPFQLMAKSYASDTATSSQPTPFQPTPFQPTSNATTPAQFQPTLNVFQSTSNTATTNTPFQPTNTASTNTTTPFQLTTNTATTNTATTNTPFQPTTNTATPLQPPLSKLVHRHNSQETPLNTFDLTGNLDNFINNINMDTTNTGNLENFSNNTTNTVIINSVVVPTSKNDDPGVVNDPGALISDHGVVNDPAVVSEDKTDQLVSSDQLITPPKRIRLRSGKLVKSADR